jgi:hypothetical protein
MTEHERAPSRVFGILKGNRRFFSDEDDQFLRQYKAAVPELSWADIASHMPGFSPRQLRERWCNYLCPNLNLSQWTDEDDARLLQLHQQYGPAWRTIGTIMGNRSSPDVKNRFQSMRNKHERETKRSHRKQRANQKVLGTAMPNVNTEEQTADWSSRSPNAIDRAPAETDDKDKKMTYEVVDFSIKNLLA